MAYTVTLKKVTVFGDQKVAQYAVTSDAVSGVVSTKLKIIDSASLCPVSMNTGGIKVKINAATAAAASNGKVNLADLTSGDDLFLIVYGR